MAVPQGRPDAREVVYLGFNASGLRVGGLAFAYYRAMPGRTVSSVIPRNSLPGNTGQCQMVLRHPSKHGANICGGTARRHRLRSVTTRRVAPLRAGRAMRRAMRMPYRRLTRETLGPALVPVPLPCQPCAAFHGLMRLTPVPVKSEVLRVARVAFSARQMAAIWASEVLIGWPARSRSVTTSAY